MSAAVTPPTCVALVLFASVSWSSAAEAPSQQELLGRIAKAPPHPRLFWTSRDEAAVREKLHADPQLQAIWEAVRVTADRMLTEPPVVYRKDGRRLLGRSREALSRMMHLGFACRLTGDGRYAERAMVEMQAMAAMPDWNPSHFLDTAEMTLAMAVGYDWLFDRLSAERRQAAREAIESKGLGPYLKPGARHGWERGGNNWNQVCHAGMVAGALALLEDNPERAAEVVRRALAGLPNAMKVYDPDGTYPEGPGYWNYGTSFNVMLIHLLESALGSDFNLCRSPGFLKAGEFMLHIMGPTRRTFNFSDCGTGTGFSPAMTWFAARTARPDLLWFETELLGRELDAIKQSRGRRQGDRYFPLVLLWSKAGLKPQPPETLNWLGRGQNPIAVLRTSWTDADAVYVAIKAGTPSASHAHMDIGSFVLDAEGTRWSLDLGAEDYNALEQRGIGLWNGQQGSERWRIFRYHNRAHSTLLVNDAEQVVSSKAPISEFSPDPKNAFAVVDMSATYANQLASAIRRFSLEADKRVTIEDKLTGGSEAATVRWGMVTPATLKIESPNRGWLEQSGKRLRLEVLSPPGAALQSWPADPPPNDYDARNPGVSIVGFTVPVGAGEKATLKVILQPGTPAAR
ncbi:MAG TPA: heparinase II/III family protein [Verrucomicrobiota bacterium]|nr:heparinase II/III family protein [Verrucomicrobiota bacterium]HRT55055.1 heparinase II/III family protein [Candidatus Paceibacterota bacterium]